MREDEEMYGRNSVRDGYIDLNKIEKEKKKLSPTMIKVLICIAAVALVAVVIYIIAYFMRPTVGELQDYNTLQNLTEKYGTLYLCTVNENGSEGSYFVKDGEYVQTAKFSDYPGDYKIDLEYNDKRYVVNKDKTVYSYFSNTPPGSIKQFENLFFDIIPFDDLDKRPTIKDGKYVYRYKQNFGTNTSYVEFVFNKDMSVSKIALNSMQVWNVEYGVQKDFFEPLKKFDLNDLVRVNLENMYDPDNEFEPQYVPRGMCVTGHFYVTLFVPDPENQSIDNSGVGVLELFADSACVVPFKDGDKDLPVEEDMTLYLNLTDAG